jgi:hypothetical protein
MKDRFAKKIVALGYEPTDAHVTKVAAIVQQARNAEREQCAKICDALAAEFFRLAHERTPSVLYDYRNGASSGSMACAESIRAATKPESKVPA